MVGVMDDWGLFPGRIKFEGDGGTPNELSMPGVEKSSSTLLKMIPVLFPRTLDPKLKSQTHIKHFRKKNCDIVFFNACYWNVGVLSMIREV